MPLSLKVVTTDRLVYEGEVDRIAIRTTEGDACFLPRHDNYLAAVGTGAMRIYNGDEVRLAAVNGGFVEMDRAGNAVTVVTLNCEWADEIDVERAQAALEEAEKNLVKEGEEQELSLASARIKKELNRLKLAGK